jgi:hypothetical protein
MALVNPNIAMGYQGIQLPNQLAQYSQIEQIKNAQQANQLNQLRMEEYQLEKQNKNALSQAYAQSFDPTSGKLDYNKLTGLLAQGGQAAQIPGLLKQRTEEERAATEEAARRAKLMQDTQMMYRDLSSQIGSKQDAVAFLKTVVNDPAMKDSPLARIPLMQQIQRIPDDAQGLDNWIKQFSLGATKYFTENKPVTFAQDTGSGGRLMSRPGLGGATTVVPGSEFTKTPTFADRNAAAQLNLAQQKFAFEQANPTLSIQEDATGLLAVNTRTGVATPVVYGPNGFQAAPAVAPTAAPAASIMRQPTAAMPNQLVPAIPGMTSVLDRTATLAATPMPMPTVEGGRVAGAPVGSKKEAPVKFNDTDLQLAGLAGSLKDFKDEISKQLATGAKFLPAGADTARMQAKYTALLMGVKDLYTLGALTGPDMSIIESQLTNPASWSGKFTTQKGFEEQTKVIEDMLKRSSTNLENTYNRQPRATKKALDALGTTGVWSVVR